MMFNKIYEFINGILGGGNLSQNPHRLKFNHAQIADLLPYRSFDSERKVFINDNSIGFILEGSPLVGANDGVVEAISGVFTDGIPEGCSVQFLNWASPKIGDIFDHWRQPRDLQGGIYQKIADERIKHFKEANHKSLFGLSSPYTLKNFRLVVAVSMPFREKNEGGDLVGVLKKFFTSEQENEDKISEVTKKICSFREKLKAALNTAGIQSSVAGPEELINFLDEIINFDVSPWKEKLPYDPLNPINKQIIDPENVLVRDKEHVTLYHNNPAKEIEVRSFSVRNFPTHWAQWQCRDLIGDYFQDLRRMEYPFLTFFSVTLPKNSEKLVSMVEAKSIRATNMARSDMAKYDPSKARKASEWKFVKDKLDSGQKILKTMYQVVVFAPKDKIEEAEQTIKSIYKACGWVLARDQYLQLPAFLTIMPFTLSEGYFNDMEKMGKTRTMVSWTVANLAPLQGEYYGMGSPFLMLFGRRGQVFFWDPFANKGGNFNCIVVGTSGSGKSVLMQEIVTSSRGRGGIVYVIDDGRSFMHSCNAQGGEFVEFSDKAESAIVINPFSVVNPETMKKSPEYKTEVIRLITAIVSQMCEGDPTRKSHKNLDPIQMRLIEKAVGEIWEEHETDASITTIMEYFKDYEDPRGKDLATLVEPFTKKGVLGRFFEGKSTVKLSNPFMVFETAELKNKKELQSIVVMFLMFMISENMYFGSRKRQISLVIDEAWDLLHGEGSAIFIEGMARRARKYGGNLILGTQSLDDFYKTPATKAALDNSDFSLYLRMKKDNMNTLEKSGKINFESNPGLREMLESTKTEQGQYSELVAVGPFGYFQARMVMDRFSILLYSSAADDVARKNKLTSEGHSVEEAIGIMIEEEKKNFETKFLSSADFRKVMDMTQNQADRISHEDAFEVVIKKKMQTHYPDAYQSIYSQQSMRL